MQKYEEKLSLMEDEMYSIVGTVESGDLDSIDIYFESLNNLFISLFGDNATYAGSNLSASLKQYSHTTEATLVTIIENVIDAIDKLLKHSGEVPSSGEISQEDIEEAQNDAYLFETRFSELIDALREKSE